MGVPAAPGFRVTVRKGLQMPPWIDLLLSQRGRTGDLGGSKASCFWLPEASGREPFLPCSLHADGDQKPKAR